VSDFRDIETARVRRDAIRRLIAFLATGRSPNEIGKRVMVLDFLLAPPEAAKQKDLARRLGVSKQRASAAIDFLREKIAALSHDSESDY
jgi:hypothetical protein